MPTFLEVGSVTQYEQGDTREITSTTTTTSGPKRSSIGERRDTTSTTGNNVTNAVTTGTDQTSSQSKADIAFSLSFRLYLRAGLGSPLPTDYVSDPCA